MNDEIMTEDGNDSFHFFEDDDIIVKVSHAIFEDFHSLITTGLSFDEVIKNLYDICNNGVESIQKLSAGIRKGDPTLQKILSQLCEERNAYFLILSLFESELSVRNKQPTSGSLLENLLIKNAEFRKLHTLLKWVEAKDVNQPHGFSGALNIENINFDEICAKLGAWNRNQELEAVLTQKTLKPHYEESIIQLFQIVLAYIRCGQIEEAVELASESGCFTLAALIDIRSALFEFALTPKDPNDENYGFSDTRSSFKHVARKNIDKVCESSQLAQLQHCIWAALSGSLPQLLTYSTCTDDRLWSYLNCVVESMFDEYLVHDSDRKFFNEDDLPKTVSEIFNELFRSETSPIYKIYGYLSTMEYNKIDEVLISQINSNTSLPAHVARFYAHLVLLLKFMGKELHIETSNLVISQFVDVLINLNQFILAPYYLAQMSEGVRKQKFIQLLRCTTNESVRKEVLIRASKFGIDSSEICIALYQEVKKECVLIGNEREVTNMISELLRAWRYLTYNGTDTIYEALIEANYIMRKLFVMDRMAEIVELIQISGSDLSSEAERAFLDESNGNERKPYQLEKAQREYQGFYDYFEAADAYNCWLVHFNKPRPEVPMKISDEKWARMDMKRRAEYELSVQEGQENQQRHDQISTSLRSNAVTLLENILKRAEEWLIALGGPTINEEDTSHEMDEHMEELQQLREKYINAIIKALVNIHKKTAEHEKILKLARMIVDTKYNIHLYLRKTELRKILKTISKSGVAIVDTAN